MQNYIKKSHPLVLPHQRAKTDHTARYIKIYFGNLIPGLCKIPIAHCEKGKFPFQH